MTLPAHIVIIDDDEAIASMMKLILDDHGYRTETFSNIDEGMTCVQTDRPSLVLLDIWMPNRSGWKIAKEIKNNKVTSSIPVVLVSADREVSEMMGYTLADGFLGKPFEVHDLISTVKQHIHS